jgi:hypothetical protein
MSETIQLSPGLVAAYKELLTNPEKNGFDFRPITECFREIETVTPKHILYERYLEYLQKPLPKVIFYIIMDELYRHLIVKDEETKYLGYRLKFIV